MRRKNEGECSGKNKRSKWVVEEPKISMLAKVKLLYFMKELTDVDPKV